VHALRTGYGGRITGFGFHAKSRILKKIRCPSLSSLINLPHHHCSYVAGFRYGTAWSIGEALMSLVF
jgi:hypothetical protein